ncbi:hypothetical protein [uncultured Tenacibaculum sp.]|uniref:hypothetical protein n=1 Tax=uncultured Tenacibaculum sp. TaxID=174713 RepID=UPI00261D946E|nr:hypothetical protein [uncultured Tenacibaculum sp.]
MNLCLLIPLIVGLITAFLGYLIGKLSSKNIKNDEIVLLKNKIAKLEASLRTCRENNSNLETDLKLARTGIETSFDSALVKKIFGKKIKENDLKIVEGIGPKIESLFHNFGIDTWKILGETSVEKCQEVLNSGGDRYKIHKPDSWPKQAQLASEGKWQELKDWQETLNGGK